MPHSKAHTPFREVWHLWITPDFGPVERGEMAPPWVDQRQLDFHALRELLLSAFGNGPLNIRVPNDTIDQVTIHTRMDTHGEGDEMRCVDLAKRLRLEGKKQAGDVLDVSRLWANRQHLTNRAVVPPPVILPLLVETHDYEDMCQAKIAAKMRLGMLKEHPIEALRRTFSGEQGVDMSMDLSPEDQQGYLPERLREALADLLGAPYQSEAVIDFVSHDPLPAWAKQDMEAWGKPR